MPDARPNERSVSSLPSHRANARASGRSAPCGVATTASTVRKGRIGSPPAAAIRGRGSTR